MLPLTFHRDYVTTVYLWLCNAGVEARRDCV
jgi:hypothetical protein